MSQGARWAALACVAIMMPAGPGLAQTAPSPTTTPPDTTLPPLSGPPIDVPMHVPQPPRDVGAPQPQAQTAPAPSPPRATVRPDQERLAAVPERGGTITPLVPQCHETTYRVIIDGRPESAVARVCRMADGRWHLAP